MELRSGLARWIADMLDFRDSIGFLRRKRENVMRRFDSYCCKSHPGASVLAEEIVRGWLASEASRVAVASMRMRANEMRTLANYIRAFGGEAYVLPYKLYPATSEFAPHVMTDAELASLFRQIDREAASESCDQAVRGAYSVLFRLIYTCGLRPQEGRTAKTADLDLSRRELFPRKTKCNAERIVGLSDEMTELLAKYTRRLASASPNGEFLFPRRDGRAPTANAVSMFFRVCWREADVNATRSDVPRVRVYDLRHRFASAVLQKWADEGRDMYSKLPVLRAYMGHAQISSTLYYVHLLPENLRRSPGVDWERMNAIIPEA